MNHLVVDQGNSFTKVAFFSGEKMLLHFSLNDVTLVDELTAPMAEFQPAALIFSSVRSDKSELQKKLFSFNIRMVELTSECSLPFEVEYATAHTLGGDRLANAAGAIKRFGGKNCLIVDFGTCITYSLVVDKKFKGGAISPGIGMRLKALNHYTGRLPLVEHGITLPAMTGRSTEDSIRAGVERAAVLEVQSMINEYCSENADLNVLLTGGGMTFFEPHLKSPIFAAPYLTLEGLHEILLIN